jgi:hypothetical protein
MLLDDRLIGALGTSKMSLRLSAFQAAAGPAHSVPIAEATKAVLGWRANNGPAMTLSHECSTRPLIMGIKELDSAVVRVLLVCQTDGIDHVLNGN